MSCKDYVNAMKWYSQAIMLSPKDGALYSNRSFAFLQLGLTSRALADAEESVRLRPEWSKAYFRRAEALLQAGLYSEAQHSYAAGASLDPEDEHLRKQCEEAHSRGTGAQRREMMLVAAAAIAGVLIILLLLASQQIQGVPSSGKHPQTQGVTGAITGVIIGGVLGGGGGVGTIWLRRQQRRGSVLPPLKSNEQFAAEQMAGDRTGAGELYHRPSKEKARSKECAGGDLSHCMSDVTSATTTSSATGPPAAKPRDTGKARVRSTCNGRAAAMRALGKGA